MKTKLPAGVVDAIKAGAIDYLKNGKFIKNRAYDLNNEDDLVEIISSAWVNKGNNSEDVLEQLKILKPDLPEINELIKIGNKIASQGQVIEEPPQFKVLSLVERSNLRPSEQDIYQKNLENHEESQRQFRAYEAKNKRLNKPKSEFSEFDKKLYTKIEEAKVEATVRDRLSKNNLAETLTVESVNPTDYVLSVANNDKEAFVESIKNIQLSGDALKQFAKGVFKQQYDSTVNKIEFDSLVTFQENVDVEGENAEKFDKNLKAAVIKKIEADITTNHSTGRCQVSIPRELRDGNAIDPRAVGDTPFLNAVIDSLKAEGSLVKQAETINQQDDAANKIQNLPGFNAVIAVMEHIKILTAKVDELTSNGFEKKANEISNAIDKINSAVTQHFLKRNNPDDEYKQAIKEAEESVNKAIPILGKSLGNELSNLWTRFTNLIFNENKQLIDTTDSAKKMIEMKKQFNELFPEDKDDNTNTPTKT